MLPMEAAAVPPETPVELLLPQLLPPWAITVPAVPNQESPPGPVPVLPSPTVTV
ncbi:MAG: hypothetical protein IPG35_09715 [Flavobacteriales bacterium]|nr:hypothetical protein [Flavobacteriales bacterium]